MMRALFASLAASLLAGCVAEPAEDTAEQDLLPAVVSRPDAALVECPQENCQQAELDMSDASDMGELENTPGGDLANDTDVSFKTQIPVDSRIRFVDKLGGEIFKVAVSGSTPPPHFAPRTEYWSRVKPLKVDVMTMESVGFSDSPGTPKYNKDFNDWLVHGNIITTAQETSPQQWILGTYESVAPKKALYWAVDPDEPSTKRIGLLLELGGQDELLSMTWYKKSRPSKGQIFNKIPSSLRFTLVPGSTLPSDIDQDATWYYFHCVTSPG